MSSRRKEATKRTVTAEFFARHSVAKVSGPVLAVPAGRLAHPMVLRPVLPAHQLGCRLSADRRKRNRLVPTEPCSTHRGAHKRRYWQPFRSFGITQPARLLQHVPRVLGCGADRLDRNRKSVTIGDVEHAD